MTAAVVKSATYLEGSVAELSLASWTLDGGGNKQINCASVW